MQYRINRRNGDRLSVLGYGCMRFTRKGGGIDLEKAEREMLLALKKGVNYISCRNMIAVTRSMWLPSCPIITSKKRETRKSISWRSWNGSKRTMWIII